MSVEIGTLSELSAKPGDVVEPIGVSSFGRETLADPQGTGFTFVNEEFESLGCVTRWRMVERRPRTWGELTDAEKGALLLAENEGKCVQFLNEMGNWQNLSSIKFTDYMERIWFNSRYTYRIKPPEPAIETREGTCRAYIYKHSAPFLCDTKVPGTVEGKWTAEVKDGVPQKITWELSNV